MKFDLELLRSQKEMVKNVEQVTNLAREYQKQHEELVSLRDKLAAITQGEPSPTITDGHSVTKPTSGYTSIHPEP